MARRGRGNKGREWGNEGARKTRKGKREEENKIKEKDKKERKNDRGKKNAKSIKLTFINYEFLKCLWKRGLGLDFFLLLVVKGV